MNSRLFSSALIVLALLASGVATAEQFIVPARVPAPDSQYVAEADFNGDGIPDLASWGYDNFQQQSVLNILLGNGDGTFSQGQQITFSNGAGAAGIVTGDWNDDGVPDMVLLEATLLWVYVGNGDGTFTQTSINDIGNGFPHSLIAGDLNGDGIGDLIAANQTGSSVTVLLGQGGGVFGLPVNYDLGNIDPADDVIVADFNRDGKLDVAVAQPDAVAVLVGNGDGSLQAAMHFPAGTSSITHLDSGDFNHDGVPDLAVGGFYVLGVLLGKGDGTFAPANSYPELSDSGPIRVADVNGDGNPDVLAVNTGLYGGAGVAVFLGYADGSFQPAVLFGSNTYDSLAMVVADFDLDGALDIVVSDYSAAFLSLLPGKPDGTFVAPRDYEVQSLAAREKGREVNLTSAAVANLDSDLNPDVALLESNHDRVIVLRGKSNGTFSGHRQFQTGRGAETLALADFNGDGRTDIVTDNNSGISVLIGNGNGNFAKHVEYPGPSAEVFVAAADVNGDGKPDVIAANDGGKTVSVYLNDGAGHFNTRLDTSMANEPFQVWAADFNQDGKLDVLTANRGDRHAATILLGNGDGTFSVGQTYAVKKMPGALVFGVVVADFNVDGKLDFAVSSDGMFVFPGNGDGTFGSYIETPNVDSYSPRVGDFNRDGKPDIIGPDYFLTGKGDGTFNVEVNLPVEGLDAEAVGDFNHDGAPDVINGGGDFVTVLLNTGAK